MLRVLLRGKAVRSLCSQRMSVAGTLAWHQPPPTALSSLPRSLNVHAAVFVPKLRAVAASATGALGATRCCDSVAHHSAELNHFRPALPPISSPCSTSGRDSLTLPTPSAHRRPADYGHRSRDIRTCAVAGTAATPDTLEAGCIIEFKTDTRQELALLQRPNGKSNWFATDVRGQTYSLQPKQMVYTLPGSNYKEADLHQIHEEALQEADVALLADAWEMVHEDNEVYSVTDMAELLFGNLSATSCYASHRLLSQERIFFKQVGRSPPRFQARSEKDVQSLKAKRQIDEKAAAEVQAFVQEMKRCYRLPYGEKPSMQQWQSGPYCDRIMAMQAFALDTTNPAEVALAIQMSQMLRGTDGMQACNKQASPSAASELLQSAGWWRPHEQIGLLKANRAELFPAAVQALADELQTSPPPDSDAAIRQDLTHHEVVTIDDASTRDIDDGLAVEVLPDGRHKLWVHIADPTRWVNPGDPLDVEARRRAKTLYLPTGNIPMFPRNLADGIFSLHLERPTAALSVHMTLDPDGSLEECGLVASTVTPTRKLTYAEVDELLDATMPEQEPTLWALNKAAEARERWREEQGALTFQMPEAKLRVQDPHRPDCTVHIRPAQGGGQEQPSQRLVSEMMILAGQAIARIGEQNNLALPYRGQPEPVLPSEDELRRVPAGPCRTVLVRSRMIRGSVTTNGPSAHAGLGLDGYVQFTSPIRRYGDMLAHYQLKAFLRGQSALPAYELSQLSDISGSMAQEAILLEREVTNYWLAHFFQAEKSKRKDRSWEALLLMWLRTESGLARVLLPELGLETVMRINRPARPGDTLHVCVGFVDVPKGVYTLNEVDHLASTSLSSADLDEEDIGDASSQVPVGMQEPKSSHDRGAMAVVNVGEPAAEPVATATPQ
ncbi:hypothetical protein ABBQ32_000455 [Trebouxia sp. C0010 RCD-2024]